MKQIHKIISKAGIALILCGILIMANFSFLGSGQQYVKDNDLLQSSKKPNSYQNAPPKNLAGNQQLNERSFFEQQQDSKGLWWSPIQGWSTNLPVEDDALLSETKTSQSTQIRSNELTRITPDPSNFPIKTLTNTKNPSSTLADNLKLVHPVDTTEVSKPSQPQFVSGELLVKFTSAVDTVRLNENGDIATGVTAIDTLFSNKKSTISSVEPVFKNTYDKSSSLSNVYKIVLPEANDEDLSALITELKKNPDVVYAERNGIAQAAEIPNDPSFNQLWGLQNTGQTGGTPDADIDATEAWDLWTGDNATIIAITDTGVDYTHPDLAEKMWINPGEDINHNGVVDPEDFNGVDDDGNGFIDDVRGWDFVYGDNNPNDVYGHGTHCSGTTAAIANNGVGITGVCWNCRIMPVKCLGDDGNGPYEAIANSIIYATDMGAKVISMSLGGSSDSSTLQDAVEYAYNHDVVICVAAMNNNNQGPAYPAMYEHVIAVAATDHNDKKASFSNYGTWVDVSAPGVNILSTFPDNQYKSWQGTSMATPHVAGLAALIRSLDPYFSNVDVINQIVSTTDNIDALNPGYEGLLGSGRVNARRALEIYEHNLGVKAMGISPGLHVKCGTPMQVNSLVVNNGMNDETNINVSLWINNKNVYSVIVPALNRNTCQSLTFGWIPLDVGVYTITVNVTVPGVVEGNYDDNEKTETVVVGVQNLDTGECFGTIQQAIDDSDTVNGHRISVPSGVYHESIVITKGISLQGAGNNTTIIDGNGPASSILLIQNISSVSLTGFTIENGLRGVCIDSSSYVNIQDTVIRDNAQAGFCLVSSNNVAISNNRIEDNSIGVSITDSSHTNVIVDNEIVGNQQGVVIEGDSASNLIYNNLLNNMQNAYDECSNQWDNGYQNGYYPGGGNWWSDYTGTDNYHGENQDILGPDLVGDTPYHILGGINQDRYPLMNPGHLPQVRYVDADNTAGPWDGTLEHPYQNIQEALDVADTGDTIYVWSGIYEGSLKISKWVRLLGENRDTTEIAGDTWYDLYVTVDHVQISGFTITNMYPNLNYDDTAIVLAGVSDCTITNNRLLMGGIIFASKEGHINGPLELNQWNTHVIEDNYAYNGRIYYFKNNDEPVIAPSDAVQVILANCSNVTIQHLAFDQDVGVPVQLGFSSYNNIIENTITQQYWDGILLRNSPANIISENQIIKLEDGDSYSMELLYESDHNIVKDNLLAYAWNLGIFVWESSYNIIDNCTIIDCGADIWVREYSSHISITNCTLGGIRVWDSSDVLIMKNTVSAVYLGGANNVTINQNNICNVGFWGIRSDLCNDVIITDNFITSPLKQGRVQGDYYEGILLLNALNHTVIGNTLISLGLTIGLVEIADEETTRLCYTSHTMENNTANGKPIYYYKNMDGPFTVPLDAGQVILANCSNFIVQDISIDDVSFGVTATYCSEITIANVTVTNSDIGIVIIGSDSSIQNCPLYDNREYGIEIAGSNNTISDCRIYDNEYSGVILFGNQNSITNCVINNLSSTGIGIFWSPDLPVEGIEETENNTVLNCTLSNINSDPVVGTSSVGIWVYSASSNLIARNSITNNKRYGILIDTACHNNITDNLIKNTAYDEYAWPEPAGDGVCLYESSSDNIVSGNTFLENYQGISIKDSLDNHIYHNNFLRNNQNAYDNTENTWDADENGGNFWDDYTGVDHNNDGMGDIPYSIPGGSGEDRYPLIRPISDVFPVPAPKTVYVDDDYPPTISGWGYNRFGEIQDAIPAVLTHGTIYVSNGIYYENIVIGKPLTLQGENAETTIIRSSGSPENVISIRGTNDVTISNFTLTQGYCGISVESSDNIFIHHNSILENTIGIAVNDQSHTIEIAENIIHGITRKTALPPQKNLNKDSKSITVQNTNQNKQIDDKNVPRSSSIDGILLENTNTNVIRYNTITGNQEGIRITTGSTGNQIYNNNFIDNQVSAYDAGNENRWNRGPFGNYWSDYNGVDTDGDGIGDTPFIISGGENQDSYPLMYLFNPTKHRVLNFDTRKTFLTIQDAIDDPQTTNGQTLFVCSGIYHENIVVDKSLHLIGENKDTTIIYGDTGSEEENGMHLIAHRISITGFTIQNCAWYAIYAETNGNIIRDNILRNNKGGIVLLVSSDNIIERNTFTQNEWYGIWIADSTNNVISGNTITHHGYDGIQMGATDYGPGCSNTVISGNYFYWNGDSITIGYDGTYPSWNVPPMQSNIDIIGNTIEINGPLFMWYTQQCNLVLNTFIGTDRGNYIGLMCSANNNISGNTFTHMGESIWLVGGVENSYLHEPCENNVISKNTFQNGGGIIIDNWEQGAYNNMIYFNNFIDSGAEDKCNGNIWDHEYPDGGNYWASYTGVDGNGDGIGDTPCKIGGKYPPALDRYPLMEPWSGELPKPKSVYVDDDYDETISGWRVIRFASVQEGVSAVADGGSVNVASGTYDEHVMIEKPLRLIGEDKSGTILTDSSRTGPIISVYNTDSVTITGFTIMHGEQGIFINSADNNVVFENVITQNQEGIRIEAGGINNHIYHNDFIMNVLSAYDAGSNIWDYDYPFGGNYWSDYNGSDGNGDNIGDTPYNISGGINQDRYPLMSPYELPVYEYPVTNLNTKQGFFHIQDAIDDPLTLPGHSIYVQSGTYNEHLIVNKSVNLIGEDQVTTIIDGENQAEMPVVNIISDHVTLKKFTIRRAGVYSNGIEIRSNNVAITDNIFFDIKNAGIYLKEGGSHVSISKNKLQLQMHSFGICSSPLSAHETSITDNLITGGSVGIRLDGLSDLIISRNTVRDNEYDGIVLQNSFNTSIVGNAIINNPQNGLSLSECSTATIIDNTLVSNDITISGSVVSSFNTHTIENNTVNGKPIYYYKNMNGPFTVPSDAGQVILANCTNFTIQNLHGDDIGEGIQLGFSSRNTILGNTMTHSKIYSIMLQFSSNNHIIDNTIADNDNNGLSMYSSNANDISNNTFQNNGFCGLYIWDSSNNIITNCHIANNNAYGVGIWQYSNNNIIYHNNLINNHHQNAYDSCSNIWYNSTLQQGNYWSDFDEPSEGACDINSDGIIDTLYNISGKTPPNQDRYPLVYRFILGDMNVDGMVNWRDVDPFVLAMSDPATYQSQYHMLPMLHGDINQDGVVSWRDIGPFIVLLNGG